jgi:hypothetical protein
MAVASRLRKRCSQLESHQDQRIEAYTDAARALARIGKEQARTRERMATTKDEIRGLTQQLAEATEARAREAGARGRGGGGRGGGRGGGGGGGGGDDDGGGGDDAAAIAAAEAEAEAAARAELAETTRQTRVAREQHDVLQRDIANSDNEERRLRMALDAERNALHRMRDVVRERLARLPEYFKPAVNAIIEFKQMLAEAPPAAERPEGHPLGRLELKLPDQIVGPVAALIEVKDEVSARYLNHVLPATALAAFIVGHRDDMTTIRAYLASRNIKAASLIYDGEGGDRPYAATYQPRRCAPSPNGHPAGPGPGVVTPTMEKYGITGFLDDTCKAPDVIRTALDKVQCDLGFFFNFFSILFIHQCPHISLFSSIAGFQPVADCVRDGQDRYRSRRCARRLPQCADPDGCDDPRQQLLGRPGCAVVDAQGGRVDPGRAGHRVGEHVGA